MTSFHPNTERERERPSAWVGIVFLITALLLLLGGFTLAIHLTRGVMP